MKRHINNASERLLNVDPGVFVSQLRSNREALHWKALRLRKEMTQAGCCGNPTKDL